MNVVADFFAPILYFLGGDKVTKLCNFFVLRFIVRKWLCNIQIILKAHLSFRVKVTTLCNFFLDLVFIKGACEQ